MTLPKYTWGPDMSRLAGDSSSNLAPLEGGFGEVHGAAGVGGLLAAHKTHATETTADDASYGYLLPNEALIDESGPADPGFAP